MLKMIRTVSPWIGAAGALTALLLINGCHRGGVDDQLSAGDAAMQKGQLNEAETDYNDAVRSAPNDPRTHIALGNLYIFEHKSGPAQVEFMKVLDIDPKNAATHVALGNLYMDQDQYPLAENQYRAAVALESERPQFHLDLAQDLIKQNKLKDAEDEIRTAIGLDPKNAQAHYALGNLLSAIPDRADEAKAEFDQARALDPKLAAPGEAAQASPAAGGAPPSLATEVTPAAPGGAETAAAAGAAGAAAAAGAAPAGGASIASAGGAAPKIKPLNKLFLLTKNSPVYQGPDETSAVVAQVRSKKYVHVTGLAGNYLQIRLKNGTMGFIPISAAE
jgi:tetratricopeptide (TPR) repeat protein